jgi:hypothetical protein
MGKVTGHDGKEEVVIRTSDTQKSFLFSKEPDPRELAEETYMEGWGSGLASCLSPTTLIP